MPPRRSPRNASKDQDNADLKDKPKNAQKKKLPEEPEEAQESPKPKKKKTTKVEETNEPEVTAENIYEFKANDINGEEVSLDKYKGHVCIIVNVASRCGHTKSNYEQFVELYSKYSDTKGLRILAFPCNQFGGQEPGDSEKICNFAKSRNVEFDMFEKVAVNGKNAHPLWKYMKEQIAGPNGKDIKWNFTKFIIDKEGKVVERHTPATKPLKLVDSLEKLF
ncbi:phospholipid hydroperoxide glutathione peroxidase-like [Aethina tumida]|uniref:phospholipid hydroperoxide glutathione peroxidase-like n=1 Tax=Aethina tumida TaxID=116153 RepID=UPI00096B1C1C|nr:phospholipid hydroperoxide glutathione peroxidase-like [Aethina tumida]